MGRPARPIKYREKITELQEKIIVALIKQEMKENNGNITAKSGIYPHIKEKYGLTKSDLMQIMRLNNLKRSGL